MKANKKNFIVFVTILLMFINCFTFVPGTILHAKDKIVINEVHFQCDKYIDHLEDKVEFIEGEKAKFYFNGGFNLIDQNYPNIKVNAFAIQQYINNDWKNAEKNFSELPHRYLMTVQCYDASYVLTENTKVYINAREYSADKIKKLIEAIDGKTILSLTTEPKTPLKKVYPPSGLSYDYNGSEIVGVKESDGYKLTGNIEKNAGKYTAIATLTDGYIWYDKTKNERLINWEIKKAKVQQVPSQDKQLEAYQFDKLSTVILGNDWKWVNPETIIKEKGEQNFKAIYAPNGEFNNYEPCEVDLKVNVKEKLKVEAPQAVQDLVYNKKEQIGVIEGTGYALTNNKSTNAGEYTAIAKLQEGYAWEDGTHDNKEILWSIVKAPGSSEDGYEAPSNLEATQGKKLSDIKLPENWSWVNHETSLDTVGDQNFDAKYTPKDSDNYKDETAKVSVKVNKKPDIKISVPQAIEGLVYNQDEQKGVNEGEGYTLSTNKATNAGQYTAVATLLEGYVWEDGSHDVKEISWSIAKAFGSEEEGYKVPDKLEATQGEKLSKIELPENWSWIDASVELNEIGEQNFEAKYTPKDNKNYEEVTASLSVKVNKKPDIKIDIPEAIEGLVYNKEEQTGVIEGDGYTLTNNKSTNAGSYTAVAKLEAGYIWSDETYEDKEISWSIAKAAGSKEDGYEIPSNLEATQGDKLSKVVLPEHWSWVNPETTLDTVGEQSFDAKYTPKDNNNYEEVTVSLSIKVNKKPDIEIDVPKAIEGLVYNKDEQIGVNEGEGYTLSTNTATNAGEYTSIAKLQEGYAWEDGSYEYKEISWSIAKAAGSEEDGYEIPSNLEAIQGQKLSEIRLPENWSWVDDSVELNEIGEQSFDAKYTPKDSDNYKEETVKVLVKVNKKPDVKIYVPEAIEGLVYNKEEQTGVIEGEGYTLTNNKSTNAGEYTAIAKLQEGYVWKDGSYEEKKISWSIAKASGSSEDGYEVPESLEATEGQKLSDIKLPEHWSWINPETTLDTVGDYSFGAKYTPEDSKNYKEVSAKIIVKVNKKPDIRIEAPQAIKGLIYNKTKQTGVIEGTGYTLTKNTATNAGSYTAIAKLQEGYAWKDGSHEDKKIPWSIAKAAGSKEDGYEIPSNLEATQGDKLSKVVLPEHWSWVNPETTLDTVGNQNFDAKYTPKDSNNYKEVSTKITVKVNKASTPKVEDDDNDYEYEHEEDDYDYYYYRRQRIREDQERRAKERQLAEEKAREEKRAAEAKKEKELVSRRLILSIGSKSVNKFGTIINNDVAPIIKNQRTMLPARLVAESLGATVTWNPVSRTVIIIGNNIKAGKLVNIVLTIDSKFAMINGVQTELDSPTFIENRRTYTPVRLIAELLGADVEWDAINNNVIIIK